LCATRRITSSVSTRGSLPPGISAPAKRSHLRNSRRWRASVVKTFGGPLPVAMPSARAIVKLTRPMSRAVPGAMRASVIEATGARAT
jgi:hypothetical protein